MILNSTSGTANAVPETTKTTANELKEVDTNYLLWLSKVREARHQFHQKGFKNSGYNTHNKFKYATIEDILIQGEPILYEVKLLTWYDMKNRSMDVIDVETGFKKTLSLDDVHMEYGDEHKSSYTNNLKLQDKGKTQTYYRKYLYMQLFDIIENDAVDEEAGRPEEQQTPEKTNKKQVKQAYQKPKVDVQTLIQTIESELYIEGIPNPTPDDILEYGKRKWEHQEITPDELRQLRKHYKK